MRAARVCEPKARRRSEANPDSLCDGPELSRQHVERQHKRLHRVDTKGRANGFMPDPADLGGTNPVTSRFFGVRNRLPERHRQINRVASRWLKTHPFDASTSPKSRLS